ncbi:MAG: hypothetical protein BIFFINMI_01497 [Phycisphaerae bacterium]|nr:hypothetical protein [Phycisphaerae bacterium]
MQPNQPTPSRRVTLLVLVACVALLPASAALRAADGPTSRPDADPALTPKEVHTLEKMASKLNRYRWADPVVEEFKDAGAAKQWTAAMGGKVGVANGELVVAPGNANGLVTADHTIPKGLTDDATGLRIDVDLKVSGLNNVPQAGIYLSSPGAQFYQWDYIYFFAFMQNGRNQRLQAIGQGGPLTQSDEMKNNQLVRVTMAVTGNRLHGQRDGKNDQELASVPALQVGREMRMGLTARGVTIRVQRITYRRLVPVHDPGRPDPALWRDAPLPSQEALDEYLRRRVIPALSAGSWQERHDATEMLLALMPLSQQAVVDALKRGNDPEGEARLEMVRLNLAVKVEKLDAAEDTPPKAPTTQPKG